MKGFQEFHEQYQEIKKIRLNNSRLRSDYRFWTLMEKWVVSIFPNVFTHITNSSPTNRAEKMTLVIDTITKEDCSFEDFLQNLRKALLVVYQQNRPFDQKLFNFNSPNEQHLQLLKYLEES